MALRRRLAERMSRLKPAGLETPVISEIPLRAEIISQLELPFPPVLGRIPIIVKGKAYGEVAGRWYRVVFPRALKDPSVTPVGVARGTTLPKVTVPTIAIKAVDKIPKVDLPVITITVPRIKWKIPTADDFIDGIKEHLGDWSVFNWMRDALAYAYGHAQYWGYSTFTKPWQVKMNAVLGNVYTSFDNTRKAINDTISRINDRIETVRTRVNDGFDTLRDNTKTAVDGGLARLFPALYGAWGIPRNMALTPLHVRNVTRTGFEFQSYGKTTCYYIAVGERL